MSSPFPVILIGIVLAVVVIISMYYSHKESTASEGFRCYSEPKYNKVNLTSTVPCSPGNGKNECGDCKDRPAVWHNLKIPKTPPRECRVEKDMLKQCVNVPGRNCDQEYAELEECSRRFVLLVPWQ